MLLAGEGFGPQPGRVLVQVNGRELDGEIWAHVSMSRRDGHMPAWRQMRDTWWECMGENTQGLIVVAPKSEHVDIAEVAHVWGCLTKPHPIPDFSHGLGTI